MGGTKGVLTSPYFQPSTNYNSVDGSSGITQSIALLKGTAYIKNGIVTNYSTFTIGTGIEIDGDLDLSSTSFIYFGDPSTDGSWRLGISGSNLSFDHRVSGSWTNKQTITG